MTSSLTVHFYLGKKKFGLMRMMRKEKLHTNQMVSIFVSSTGYALPLLAISSTSSSTSSTGESFRILKWLMRNTEVSIITKVISNTQKKMALIFCEMLTYSAQDHDPQLFVSNI